MWIPQVLLKTGVGRENATSNLFGGWRQLISVRLREGDARNPLETNLSFSYVNRNLEKTITQSTIGNITTYKICSSHLVSLLFPSLIFINFHTLFTIVLVDTERTFLSGSKFITMVKLTQRKSHSTNRNFRLSHHKRRSGKTCNHTKDIKNFYKTFDIFPEALQRSVSKFCGDIFRTMINHYERAFFGKQLTASKQAPSQMFYTPLFCI